MNLKFNNRIKNKIISILHSGKGLPNYGGSCFYIRINKYIGVKLYNESYLRNESFKNQNKLLKKGLAPNVGDKFQIPYLNYTDSDDINWGIRWKKYYCFITQHVNKVHGKKDYKQVEIFLNKMIELGYDIEDLENEWNIGKINNRVVCIDTDPNTLTKD